MRVRSKGAASFAATSRIGSRSRADRRRASGTALIATCYASLPGRESENSSFLGSGGRQPHRAPADHAAREVGDATEAQALEDHDRLGGSRARAAHGDDWALAVELSRALREIAEGKEPGALDVAERPRPFRRFTDIDDLHVGNALLERRGLQLVDAGESQRERSPGLHGRRLATLGSAATQVRRDRDVDLLRMRQP